MPEYVQRTPRPISCRCGLAKNLAPKSRPGRPEGKLVRDDGNSRTTLLRPQAISGPGRSDNLPAQPWEILGRPGAQRVASPFPNTLPGRCHGAFGVTASAAVTFSRLMATGPGEQSLVANPMAEFRSRDRHELTESPDHEGIRTLIVRALLTRQAPAGMPCERAARQPGREADPFRSKSSPIVHAVSWTVTRVECECGRGAGCESFRFPWPVGNWRRSPQTIPGCLPASRPSCSRELGWLKLSLTPGNP